MIKFFGILAAIMLLYTIAEKDKDAQKQYAFCYHFTLVMMWLTVIVQMVLGK